MRHLAAEITREKLFERLASGAALSARRSRPSTWKERRDGSSPHRADDLCRAREPAQDRARQGRADHQGDRRRSARARSPKSSRQPVHLFLFVKVRENWGDDPERYREMGLEFPKE